MVIELFGPPGSGKTFLIDRFLENTCGEHFFVTRKYFSVWVRSRSLLHKASCLLRNIIFCIVYSLGLILLRVATKRPRDDHFWIPKAVLNEAMLRDFSRINPNAIILLDQGSLQRIVSFILFSHSYNRALTKLVLYFLSFLLSKNKNYLYVTANVSILTERIMRRDKDPAISRFDSYDSTDSLKTKLSSITHLFQLLVLPVVSTTSDVQTMKNIETTNQSFDVFNKTISHILK